MKAINLFLSLLILSFSVSAQSNEVENLVREGIAYHDSGAYEKAISVYEKALEIDPKSSLANYELAYTYLSQNNYEKAVEHSKVAIEQKDDHSMAGYIVCGNALDMMGKPDEAIKIYEKGIKDYDNYLLYYNHALTCFNQGQIDKAYSSAVHAIQNNSSHASSHYILSKILEQEGSRIKAMLPLYFFLLLEPNSQRSVEAYEKLMTFVDQGVTKEGPKNINVVVPVGGKDDNGDFGAAEMMLSLKKASDFTDDAEGKTRLELFAETNDSVFKILGELKKKNKGFLWDFYVPFFYDLAKEELTPVYSYYISLSEGSDAYDWLDEHPDELTRLDQWMSN